MKKPLSKKILQGVREMTPLSARQRIGPILAEIIYRIRRLSKKETFTVLSLDETLDAIKEKRLSAIRFGDGEIDMIGGISTSFQKNDINLVKGLEEVIKADIPGLLICVPNMFGSMDLFEPHIKTFLKHQLYKNGYIWNELLATGRTYGDAFISRPYLEYKDKERSGTLFSKLFSIWDKEHVVLIEGAKSRLGVGNDMFAHVASLERILCPPENAYSKYKEIKDIALTLDRNKLILISLGPTAKLLAYDLFKAGYRVIDIGHTDMEYEMYLRKASKQEKVAYKYFNEINERNPEDCTDETYVCQIIAVIEP